jgi:beta-glucosidase
MTRHMFPDDFIWGAATSAQQIEGGRHQGGRGESIWDRFASIPGKIADGSNADVACDHFHRWREDIELMKWLGLGGYRFSIAWPRILPSGCGSINTAGLDFYDALVDGLLAAGIRPFPTLYHWDLPQVLQDRGGWGARDTAEAFVEYATIVARRLGDRIDHWVTQNEPWCTATLGHEEGHHAPGHVDPAGALRVAHHLLLSHGWAAAAIRKEAPAAEVGIVLIHCPAFPASAGEADRDAARWFDGFFNRWYLDPVFRGSYPEDAIADRVARGHLAGPDLPFVEDGDLAAISAPLDFLGLNYYSRAVMAAGPDGRPVDAKTVPPEELTDMGWEVYPQGLHEGLLRVHRDYRPRKIYITENGVAYDDPVDAKGRIADPKRITYLREHLLAAQRAITDGVPVAGYFTWTLMDNFEWGHGFTKKFGLCAVDGATQRRIPKESADWYRDVVSANAVADASTPTNQGESHAFDS